MRNVYKSNVIIIISMLLALLIGAGCVIGASEESYLDDRTEGWTPKLMLKVKFQPEYIDANSSLFWSDLIDFKAYTFPNELTEETLPQAAEEALRLNYGESFAGIGKKYEILESFRPNSANNVIYLISKEAVAVFEKNTGKLLFCADFRLSGSLSKSISQVELEVDLVSLNSDMLNEIQRAGDCMNANIMPDIMSVTLPLDAQGAYDLSIGMNVKSWNGTTRLAATGGRFAVYFAPKSNAFFVVTNTYIQAFDRDSGSLLLMHSYGTGTWGIHYWGQDESFKS